MPSLHEESLKSRVFRATVWSSAGYALSQVLRLTSSLVLTRLLLPEMFGVMAIAMLVSVGLALFSDVGLKPSVIRSKRGGEKIFLNTVWTTQILRGFLLWACALLICLAISFAQQSALIPNSGVYANKQLPYAIGIVAFVSVISGFESTKLLEASRHLSLGKVTKIDLCSQLVGLTITIAWALLDRSIWALIAGTLAASLIRTVMSHRWLPGTKNTLHWEREAFDEIFSFGKWIFLSSVLFFLASNGDRLILGGLVDANTLGAYVVAYTLFSSLDQAINKIIVDVAFPALSEIIRVRPHDLTISYYKFHAIIASATYFFAGTLIMSGQAIVGLLYDERYQQAGWILPILAFALFTIPIRIATQCLLALGAQKIFFVLHAIRIFVLFSAMLAGFYLLGLRGAIYGIVLSYFSSLPLTLVYARRYKMFDYRREMIALFAVLPGLVIGELLNWTIAAVAR